jgi:NAD(P)-dependent dehydrogenase (short-subunit alcohol dehydrogenase family)
MDGKDFSGTSAVVTGGASGLGEATARILASKGVHVVLADLQEDKGAALATEIKGTFVKCDVTDTDDIIAAVDTALSHGPLTFCVNCAGIGAATRTVGRDGQYSSAFPMEYFKKVVEINLIGTFDMTRIAATAMSRNDPDADGFRGAIVNTTSVAAFDGQIGQVAYSASKGGVVSLTLPLARDLSAVGVRVNTIAPGLIDTPIYGSGPESEAFKAKLGESVVFPKRLGQADEFASMAWELLSNPYMNGEVIRVDGAIRMPPK